MHNGLSNVVHKQTNRQTNATKNITSFAKEVMRKLHSDVYQFTMISIRTFFLLCYGILLMENSAFFAIAFAIFAIAEDSCSVMYFTRPQMTSLKPFFVCLLWHVMLLIENCVLFVVYRRQLFSDVYLVTNADK